MSILSQLDSDGLRGNEQILFQAFEKMNTDIMTVIREFLKRKIRHLDSDQ
jgi:hypothetical protein